MSLSRVIEIVRWSNVIIKPRGGIGGWSGDSHMPEKVRDACQKLELHLLKETDLGVV